MLPELVTLAKPSWVRIPAVSPVMLAPALCVPVAGDAAGIGDIGKATIGVNSAFVATGDAGAGIVGHRGIAEKDAMNSAGDRVASAGSHVDGDPRLDSSPVAVGADAGPGRAARLIDGGAATGRRHVIGG